jgi:four helix bundle protein
MEDGKDGERHVKYTRRRNINRGYRRLRVWQDCIDYYSATCRAFGALPYAIRRVGSQQIASVDSIHRNIAEGYCRRSLGEYLHFLNIALASTGESVSGLHACRHANQISDGQFEDLDSAAFKLENGLKRLIETLQEKRRGNEIWEDQFFVPEGSAAYDSNSDASKGRLK